MTVLEEIQSEIAPELEQLNALIDRELRSSNELMATVIAEYLRKKGKQIRPILVILTARLFGEMNPGVI
ncbi:MAG: polyprenyl synthetase family protein, partial [Paramuribaculum sp.]|nr:polyprenyl synthetase family protein [Paramuribaculum sp.]